MCRDNLHDVSRMSESDHESLIATPVVRAAAEELEEALVSGSSRRNAEFLLDRCMRCLEETPLVKGKAASTRLAYGARHSTTVHSSKDPKLRLLKCSYNRSKTVWRSCVKGSQVEIDRRLEMLANKKSLNVYKKRIRRNLKIDESKRLMKLGTCSREWWCAIRGPGMRSRGQGSLRMMVDGVLETMGADFQPPTQN